jgi:hypothetical protein
MAASLQLKRTKPTAIADPDPTLGVFVPPEAEVFKPSSLAKGFRVGLVYSLGVGFTSTINVFARDAQTATWYRAGTETGVGHRILQINCDTGPHDLWIGLTNVTGGNPIEIRMGEAV